MGGTSGPGDGSRPGDGSMAMIDAAPGDGLTASLDGRFPLEVMVVGCGPAAPQPDTPGSGLLLRSGKDALLIDCGPGTMSRLRMTLDPRSLTAVIISHFHADHYLDLVALRYLYPWAGPLERRLPVHVPAGGRARLASLAEVISERPGFFEEAFDVREFDPADELCVGRLGVRFIPCRHYVPAWGLVVDDPAGHRVVYSSDTGPNPALIEAARGADLLVVEATLGGTHEDVADRGHMTLDEAIEHAKQAGVSRVLVTHCPIERREQVRARNGEFGLQLYPARPGLRVAVATSLDGVPQPVPPGTARRQEPCDEPAAEVMEQAGTKGAGEA